jgi:hypothetical protein
LQGCFDISKNASHLGFKINLPWFTLGIQGYASPYISFWIAAALAGKKQELATASRVRIIGEWFGQFKIRGH